MKKRTSTAVKRPSNQPRAFFERQQKANIKKHSWALQIINTPYVFIIMISNQVVDIASKLLQSTDARIAEAAKRVFSSSSYPAAMSGCSQAPNNVSSGSEGDEKIPDDLPNDQYQDEDHEMNTSLNIGAGEAEHTANITDGPIEHTASSEDMFDDIQEGGKKPSSTERLQRR
jgi:hypothetical protein